MNNINNNNNNNKVLCPPTITQLEKHAPRNKSRCEGEYLVPRVYGSLGSIGSLFFFSPPHVSTPHASSSSPSLLSPSFSPSRGALFPPPWRVSGLSVLSGALLSPLSLRQALYSAAAQPLEPRDTPLLQPIGSCLPCGGITAECVHTERGGTGKHISTAARSTHVYCICLLLNNW